MNVKVLKCPLSRHYTYNHYGMGRPPDHRTVYGRDGLYLVGNDCWCELDGMAWKYDADHFRFSMDLIDAYQLSSNDLKTLQHIVARIPARYGQLRSFIWGLLTVNNYNRTSRHMRLKSMSEMNKLISCFPR